ncbi:hypothetical protein VNI00_003724 [Paramarasmius palmivorus]|uniref:DUF6534 domain-containing protein n=1 Tax=Paramarasmius palmivorus TaxID=297713 RepID=A0AAW0DTR7_9AGAR
MSDPSVACPHLDLGNTWGATLVGVIIATGLYGVTCLQTWSYFQSYKDRILVRLVVLALIALGTVAEVLSIHAIYYRVILNFGIPGPLTLYLWSDIARIPVTVAIELIVHAFYVSRIYQLSFKKDWVTPILVCFLKVVEVAISIGETYKIAQRRTFEAFAGDHSAVALTLTGFALLITNDVICTVALTFYLHKSRTGIKSTDTLINKLILYTINNGALTSVASIAVVLFFKLQPESLIFWAIYQSLCYLFASSLLSTLNSRRTIFQPSAYVTVNALELGTFRATNSTSTTTAAGSSGVKDTKSIQVLVDTHSETQRNFTGQKDAGLAAKKVDPSPC